MCPGKLQRSVVGLGEFCGGASQVAGHRGGATGEDHQPFPGRWEHCGGVAGAWRSAPWASGAGG